VVGTVTLVFTDMMKVKDIADLVGFCIGHLFLRTAEVISRAEAKKSLI